MVVLVRREQVEHGAGELSAAHGGARAKGLTRLDEILVVHCRGPEVRIEEAGEAVQMKPAPSGGAIETLQRQPGVRLAGVA